MASASTGGGSGYDYSKAPDQSDAETALLNRYETAAGQNDGFSMAAEQRLQSGQTFSDAYGPVNSFDPTADAASFGRGPVGIGQSGRTVFINGDASPSDAQLIAKAQALMASGPSAFSYSSGSANDVGGLEALDSQAAQGVKYIGPDGGIYDTPQPPTVITGHRMTADEAAAYDAANGYGGDSIRAMTPTESFFAFTTLGQTLQGVGNGLANMAHGAVTLGKQTILTASDAVGVGLYGLNNALGGRHVDYPLDSALGKSLQTQGFGPTALNAVGGVVQGTVGAVVAPFRAMYLRDPSAFGESLPGAVATALPLLKGGAVAEVAGAEALGWPGRGGSGPVPGAIGINDSTSVAALRNYYPKGGGVEFVYDPMTNQFVAGSPMKGLLDGSPHEQLAQSIGAADNPSVVGGTFQRGPNGEFFTTENSGHYGGNWTDPVRAQFQQWFGDRMGLPVNHQPWKFQ